MNRIRINNEISCISPHTYSALKQLVDQLEIIKGVLASHETAINAIAQDIKQAWGVNHGIQKNLV